MITAIALIVGLPLCMVAIVWTIAGFYDDIPPDEQDSDGP